MSVPGSLHELVERFDRDVASYRSGAYNEAQARVDFINPFLGLLGWDVDNRQGLPEAYREVVYEDRVKVGGGTKAPDYGFYASGRRRFFLEAKKPSVDIHDEVAPAVQLRRYAWSARLPLSLLTDFEVGLTNGPNVYGRLRELFREADDRYNSGLFHFRRERGRDEKPDDLTLFLNVDDEILRGIIRGLYYPESPYEFSVLPVDVLGQVYEQFLGKVIRLDDGPGGHNAVVEEKPEVRKAGGVYYTPTYIVDYIVEKTVGKLLEGKRPGPRGGASRLKIVDPACGSGSFLIGAYRYLLDWHRDRYVEDGPEKWSKVLYTGPGGQWHLTIDEKRRILLNSIHGVDIDPQAVEVTKLSLLLKVLEGESEASLATQLRMFQERALPDLDQNIKCGNSLIGPDFYDNEQMILLDEEAHYRINVFDWKTNFPQVFEGESPGFDAVIGNPPYIRIQGLKEFAPIEVEHYKQAYHSAGKGNYDIYVVFVERGLQLLNKDGTLGYILPHKFFNAKYGAPVRELISAGKHLSEVVHFGDEQVFAGATTYTSLMFLDKFENRSFPFRKATDLLAWRTSREAEESQVILKDTSASEWNFFVGSGAPLATRLTTSLPSLERVASIYVGVQTSADSVFILTDAAEDGGRVSGYSRSLEQRVEIEKTRTLPIVSGTDIRRYAPLPARQWIVFPYEVTESIAILLPWRKISEHEAYLAAYLEANRSVLRSRERGKFDDEYWYRFGRNQNIGIQTRRKLCVPRLVDQLRATLDIHGSHCLDNVDVSGITWRKDYDTASLAYLGGLLNSRLLRWIFPQVSAPFRGGFWSANRQFLGQLPIRTIDFSDPADVARHDLMVELVERMLTLHERMAGARIGRERTVIGHQIEATDRQIDRLVYELYALTDEEIGIVEEATRQSKTRPR